MRQKIKDTSVYLTEEFFRETVLGEEPRVLPGKRYPLLFKQNTRENGLMFFIRDENGNQLPVNRKYISGTPPRGQF